MMFYTPEEAIAEIRKAHTQYIGDGTRIPTPDEYACYVAKVWAVLDFTEKPREAVLIRR